MAEHAITEKNKGGRPRKPVDTSSPEFQEAVKAGIQAASEQMEANILGKLAEKVAAARAGDPAAAPSAPAGDGSMALLNQLAVALSDIGNQGTGRKTVPPEEMARRKGAHERMIRLLQDHEQAGIEHEYRLIAKVYIDEAIIEPFQTDPATKAIKPVVVVWDGIPSEAMEPVNDPAREVFGAFTESIGGATSLTLNADRRDVWVTSRGIVVKGSPTAQRRTVGNLGDSGNANPEQVGRANDPTAKHIRVLGTVHAPAKQNAFGQQSAA